ncbi:DUF4097 family beta strand repeat-containing protein [Stygiolobus caldivivus]|uniref:DUF4097 domain-containing protein n=1 Tax=Stygiolobus caldivivus TaxID=2824673 RepID=A0A8D5ZHJ1_9CREN|nr:DUF4097 family beta strand repeat-containing protein [Stygiolobus caldivivus]BCU69749.1 hypothetical protein KN1_10460 [Stygiolobus caldivivus]
MDKFLTIALIACIVIAIPASIYLVINSGLVSESRVLTVPLKLPLKDVEIRSGFADVVVEGGHAPEMAVEYVVQGFSLFKPTVNVSYKEVDGRLTLYAGVNSGTFDFGTSVVVNVHLYLPANVSCIEVNDGAGDVKIEGVSVSNTAVIRTGAGDVKVLSFSSKSLEVQSSTGDIEVIGANVSTVTLTDGAGDVELEDTVFSNGMLGTSTGSIVLVNALGKYLHAYSGTGDIDVSLSEDYDLTYYLKTSVGNIEVTAPPQVRVVTTAGVSYPPPVIYATTSVGTVSVNTT